MSAQKAEIGQKYLTKTGIPVTVVANKGTKILLKIETTGNETEVDAGYELRPYDESNMSKDARILLKAGRAASTGKTGKKVREGSLAAIIDEFLFTGKNTVKEIATELQKRAGSAAKGKDLEANVRARLFTYRRKGFRVEKDSQKRVRVAKKG